MLAAAVSARVGRVDVAPHEGDPRPVLVDPGPAAAITLRVVQRLGHVEVDLGVLEVAGEDRVHAPGPLHARQLVPGAQVLEQHGGRGELGPGVLVATRQAGDLRPHGPSAGQAAAVALGLASSHDGLQVGLGLGELPQLDPRRGPRQHQRPARGPVELAVADRERPRHLLDGRAGVEAVDVVGG